VKFSSPLKRWFNISYSSHDFNYYINIHVNWYRHVVPMFSIHFAGLSINEIIHYVNWGFLLWRVWHSSCVMARSFTSPLVFIFPNSSFQVIIIVPKICNFRAITFHIELSMLLVFWKTKPSHYGSWCILFAVAMEPIVRIEPNGFQDHLSHDGAIDSLKVHGWDVFPKKFKGYNLPVAHAFAQTFDGFRAKVGDVQLEIT
jgi:hypothetical protein